jgi:hypothetical protein
MSRQLLLSSLLLVSTLVTVAPPKAIAQPDEPVPSPNTVATPKAPPQPVDLVPSPDTAVNFSNIPGLFNRAVNTNTGRFYDYTSILGQLNTLFGWRTFPEGSYFDNMITRDAKVTETLYYSVMQAQQAGPLIRTADLPNPFDTSLMENPSYLSPGGF